MPREIRPETLSVEPSGEKGRETGVFAHGPLLVAPSEGRAAPIRTRDLSGSFASEVMNQDMADVSGAEPLLMQLLGHDL
jgi:hypothetical protein